MTMPANVERMLSTIAEVIRDLLIFVGVIAALLAAPHFFRALYGRRMDQLEQSEKVRWRAIQGEHSIPIWVNSLRPYFG